MKPIWNIDGNDVIAIQGDSPRFVRIINSLLAAQASGAVSDSVVHLNVKDTEPDGGVDAVVDQPIPGEPTGFLGLATCWQYKAQPKSNVKHKDGGGQEAALRQEIGKPYAQALIRKGYGYRFCIADDMPDEKKTEWEGWLTDEARKFNTAAPAAMVVTASAIARWVNRHTAIVAGEFRPFLANVISLSDWHREFQSITREFVPTSSWAATATAIRQHIDFTRAIISSLTVQGEAGVGKSRSVCEALLGSATNDALVAVTRDEKHALEFAYTVVKNKQARAILVADECPIKARVDLMRVAEPYFDRLRIIAIDNSLQREGGAGEIRLDHLNTEEVAAILTRNFLDLPADRRRAYSELAKGFVRLAVDLCRHDDLVPPDGRIDSIFGFFHDTYLRRRLSSEELDAVELVSLLPRVGFRDDVRSEIELLCSLPLVGLRAEDVVKAANKLKQAPGFIAFAGRYLYVTPTLIGQVAFQGAWNRWISPDPNAFLSALPESFIAPFMRQVQSAGTAPMRGTVSDFFLDWVTKLGPPSLGSEETVLRLVRLVEVNTVFALPLLKSLLQRASLDELRRLHSDIETLDGQRSRRQLVWLAEKLAHFPETFADAEEMLLRLAEAETEHHLGNSASRIWVEIFQVVLSGTPISFSDRLALLERRLRTSSEANIKLVLDAFENILKDGPGSRLASPPVLFGRIPPSQWKPADRAERRECRRMALVMAAKVAETTVAVKEGLRSAVVRNLSQLLLSGFLDEVRKIIGPPPLPDALLIEVVENVDDFFDVFCRDHEISLHHPREKSGTVDAGNESDAHMFARTASKELEAQVRQWRQSLIPRDIHSRIVTLVGQEYWHQQLEGNHETWEHALDELANELLRSQTDLQRELPWLYSPNARSAYRFGQALARADADASLLDQMLLEIPQTGGIVLARGYLEHVASLRPDLLHRINEKLDLLQEEDPRTLFAIIWSSGDEVRKVERLFAMVDRDEIKPESLRGLEYGVRDRQLQEMELLGAVDRLLRATQEGNGNAASVVLHLLYFWLRPNRQEPAVNRLRAHVNVLEVLPKVLEATLEAIGKEPNFWVDLAEDVATINPVVGLRLLAKALTNRDYYTRTLAEESLVKLGNKFPTEIMNAIGESALSPVSGWMFRIADFSKLLKAIPEHAIRAWLEQAGKGGAVAIARHLPPPVLSENNEPFIAPVTEFVLTRYEDDDEVFQEFLAGTHSGQVYSGDLASLHMAEAEIARHFLSHPLRRVREWATAELNYSRSQAQFWDQHDQEINIP